jgi:phage-related minor tail protein
MNKEATSRIGVGNLYRMMRGYANGGYVGGSMPTMVGGGGVNINIKNEAGADGYTATATARKNETGFNIDVLVRKALTDDMRNNGPMSQTISATYGLRRSA